MRKKILLTSLFLLSLNAANCLANDVIIVANIDDAEFQLEKDSIRNLFMGGTVGKNLTPVELPPNNETRIYFNTKIVGLTESRIQSYWAQMKFSGRRKPPKRLHSEVDVIAYLQNNQNSIGYLPAGTEVPETLTVIYRSQ